MVSLAEAAVVLAPLAFQLEAAPVRVVSDPFAALVVSARDRAPPTLS